LTKILSYDSIESIEINFPFLAPHGERMKVRVVTLG